MTKTCIVIDQDKIRISDDLAARVKPGGEFPRSLDWWQRIVPCWITASEDAGGRIVLTPNGHRADGHVGGPTPAVMRRKIDCAHKWLAEYAAGQVDLTAAIISP